MSPIKRFGVVTKRAIPRRALLKGTGVALALPWLDAMQPALAAETPPPMRFIGILNYYSFHAPFLFPAEAGPGYKPTRYLELLEPHRTDYTIISGLNHPDVRDGHQSDRSFFTGAPHPTAPTFRNTISLDQLAAERVGRDTRYPALNFSTDPSFSCSYTKSGVAIPPETSAARAYTKLFIDGSPAEVAAEVANVQEGRSILDQVAEEADRLRRDVGAADRDKLDQYFTSVRDLETRMVRLEDFARLPKPKPEGQPIKDPGPGEDTVKFGLMLDVARLAVQTDLTRFVTLYFLGTTKTPSKPNDWFAYHDLSHHGQDTGKIEKLAVLEHDLLATWGTFLGRMKEAKEGDARLLDRTIAVMGAAMGNASSHDATNLPILVAGGRFKHGSHLAHDPKNPPPLCNLWLQVLHELGAEVPKFGSSTSETLAGFSV
ncbi:MAG: DUF1552 domain-containing protein [Planctomycetia bacterium]|jgi:hypothetical protein